MNLLILRRVDWSQLPQTAKTKDGRMLAPTFIYCESHEYRKPYWAHGFVNNDLPRAVAYTEDLMAITPATGGFALADANGVPVRDAIFDTVQQAEAARSSATLSFKVDIDIPQTEAAAPEPTEPVSENFGERMRATRAERAARQATTA